MRPSQWHYTMGPNVANRNDANVVPVIVGECIVTSETEIVALFMARGQCGWAVRSLQCDMAERLTRIGEDPRDVQMQEALKLSRATSEVVLEAAGKGGGATSGVGS